MPEGIPPYVLVARIGSILGMSFSLAIGLLFLLGGIIVPSLIAFAAFIPSFGLMAYVERKASRDRAARQASSSH
ncbi:MAG: hypothetical protein AMXMBFR23_00420 [Chloroflexota bacterium]